MTDSVVRSANPMQFSTPGSWMSSSEITTRGSVRILEVNSNIYRSSLSRTSISFLGEAVDVSISLYILSVLEVKDHVRFMRRSKQREDNNSYCVLSRRSLSTCTTASTGRTPDYRSPTLTWRRWSSPTWVRSTGCGSQTHSWSTK